MSTRHTPRPMSFTEYARQGQSRETVYTPVIAVVKRTTERAVLLEGDELVSQGFENPQWVPRSAIEQGGEAEVGDDDIRIAQWWVDRERK